MPSHQCQAWQWASLILHGLPETKAGCNWQGIRSPMIFLGRASLALAKCQTCQRGYSNTFNQRGPVSLPRGCGVVGGTGRQVNLMSKGCFVGMVHRSLAPCCSIPRSLANINKRGLPHLGCYVKLPSDKVFTACGASALALCCSSYSCGGNRGTALRVASHSCLAC